MFKLTPLASGSKGNILLLETDATKLLIDVGVSAKNAEERMKEVGVSFEDVSAIIVTHEHSDHIKGVETIASRYDIPVFANVETAKALLEMGMKDIRFTIFTTDEPFIYQDLNIFPFSIQHDTMDPVAFTFKKNEVKVAVCTDLGYVTSLVKSHLEGCQALVIESNHEPNMVHASARPQVYKTRVLGRQGHLSNDMCCDLLTHITHDELTHVCLAHLSEECNNPELAHKKSRAVLEKNTKLTVAQQHFVSECILVN